MRTPEQNRAHVKAWRLANPERNRAIKKASNTRCASHVASYFRDYYIKNQEQKKLAARKWYAENKAHRKRLDLMRLYGVTWEWYQDKLISQCGRCAICSKPSELVVDHNHTTGTTRELICMKCNFALSAFDNDPEWAAHASEYIKRNG